MVRVLDAELSSSSAVTVMVAGVAQLVGVKVRAPEKVTGDSCVRGNDVVGVILGVTVTAPAGAAFSHTV